MTTTRTLRSTLVTLVALLAVFVAAPALATPAPPAPKAFVLSATPTTSSHGQAVKLSASLTPKGGGTPKGGTVTFRVGDTVLGTAAATKRVTTLTTTALPVGERQVVATYSGDSATREATSNTVSVGVQAARTTTTLTSTAASVTVGARPDLRATVRQVGSASARPTGTVTFTVDGGPTGTVRLNTSGVATWRPLLPEGTWEVTATYDGDPTRATSTSPTHTQTVAPAVSTVDQTNAVVQGLGTTSSNSEYIGQTFTAGRSGLLDRVDIAFHDSSAAFTVSIQTVSGGNPTGTVLATGSGVATDGRVDFATPAAVTAGTQYALVLLSEANSGMYMAHDTYVGGEVVAAYTNNPTRWYHYDWDMGFTTWVR